VIFANEKLVGSLTLSCARVCVIDLEDQLAPDCQRSAVPYRRDTCHFLCGAGEVFRIEPKLCRTCRLPLPCTRPQVFIGHHGNSRQSHQPHEYQHWRQLCKLLPGATSNHGTDVQPRAELDLWRTRDVQMAPRSEVKVVETRSRSRSRSVFQIS
jgi:hypothetical protein